MNIANWSEGTYIHDWDCTKQPHVVMQNQTRQIHTCISCDLAGILPQCLPMPCYLTAFQNLSGETRTSALLSVCTGEKGNIRSENQLRRRSSAFESLLYEKKTEDLFVCGSCCMPQTQRHTIYSHDPFTFLAPQRIKWFPVYSNGQLLYS